MSVRYRIVKSPTGRTVVQQLVDYPDPFDKELVVTSVYELEPTEADRKREPGIYDENGRLIEKENV